MVIQARQCGSTSASLLVATRYVALLTRVSGRAISATRMPSAAIAIIVVPSNLIFQPGSRKIWALLRMHSRILAASGHWIAAAPLFRIKMASACQRALDFRGGHRWVL